MQKYGRLTPIRYVNQDKWGAALWLFRCDCGNAEYTARIDQVRKGLIQSCGCFRLERLIERSKDNIKHGHARKGKRSPEYVSWRNMLDRCYDPHCDSYERYGGRGIKVCDKWREFENFLSDMGLKNSPRQTIGRIDNDSHYEPNNCRWETVKEQARNRCNSRYVEYEGRSMTIAEACELSGIDRNVVDARLRRGWTPERAVTVPTKVYRSRQS